MNYEPVSEMSRWPLKVESPPFDWIPYALSFLRRQALLIILCVVLMLGLGVAYLVTTPAKFTATVQVMIDPGAANPYRSSSAVNIEDPLSQNAFLESQMALMESEAVTRAVVRKLDLAHNWTYVNPPVGVFGLVNNLILYAVFKITDGLSHNVSTQTEEERKEAADQWEQTNAASLMGPLVTVNRLGLSTIVELNVTTTSPQLSAKLANAIVEATIEFQLEARTNNVKRSSNWMESRLVELQKQATDADAAVQRYRDQHSILNTDRGLMDSQTLGELTTALALAKTKTADAQSRYDRIHSVVVNATAQGPTALMSDGATTESLMNPVILRLRQQYLDDAQKVAEWSVRYGQNHLAVVNLRNDMAQMRRSILNELSRIEDSFAGELKIAQSTQASIQENVTAAITRSASSANQQVTLHSLQSSADTYALLYQTFLQRYTSGSQDAQLPISPAQVVSPATVPIYKSKPNGKMVMALLGVVGVGLGFGLAIARETFNRGLHTAGQVRGTTRLDCIGMIPVIPPRELLVTKGRKFADTHLIPERTIRLGNSAFSHVVNAPLSAFAEAMRQLSVSVLRILRKGNARVIGCVSTETGEGKSTVVCNLAQLISRSGRKVILLDWDLRKRSLTGVLAPNAPFGLFEVVTGTAGLRDAVYTDPVTGLDFLPASGTGGALDERHAGDVLGLDGTARLIAELKGKYDLVLVDLPPLRAVADAHGVDHLMDSLVMVVEWAKTDRDLVMEALERITRGGAMILGVVLNKVDPKRQQRYPSIAPVAAYESVMAIEG